MPKFRYVEYYRPKPPKVEGPIAASAGVLHWSKWRTESSSQFKERVMQEAQRLGVTPIFKEVEHGSDSRD